MPDSELFIQMGGEQTFNRIAEVFYQQVANDPLLSDMYPEQDLAPAQERLRLFLIQYWGGPDTYQQQRGHPRLRMRHAAFKVNPEARSNWLQHMEVALAATDLSQMHREMIWDYFERAATSMVNTFED